MAIADTIQSMQTHTTNAYDMLENGTDLTGINKNLENLSSTIFEAFLEALRNPDTLFTNLPKTSGSGSQITLNGTANAPMRITLNPTAISQDGTPTPDNPQDIHTISGNNSMVVEGKNLAYIGWASDFVSRVNNSSSAKLETYDGKNCLAFYPSAGSGEYDNKYLFKPIGGFKENTQYTFKIDKYSTSSFGDMDIAYTDGTVTEIRELTGNSWNSIVKTSTANKTIKYLKARWRNNVWQYIDIDTFMVYEGTTDTTYTPYVSQTNPINLPVENLINKSDGLISSWPEPIKIANLIKPSTDYYFSVDYKDLVGSIILRIDYKQNGTTKYIWGTGGSQGAPNYGKLEAHINIPSYDSGTEINIVIKNDGVALTSAYYSNWQLTQSKNATAYYPYGTTPIELGTIGNYSNEFVRSNGEKNLFDGTKVETTNTTNWGVTFANNVLTIQHKNSYSTGSPTYEIGTLPNGTYIMSFVGTGSIGLYLDNTYNKMLTNGTTFSVNGSQAVKFTFSADANTTITFTNIQLELGETTTPYTPYEKGWYYKQGIGKVVLDGTQGTITMPTTNRFNIDNALQDYYKETNTTYYMCTTYKAYSQRATNTTFDSLVPNENYAMDLTSGTSNTIRFKDTRYTTIADFTSSLSSNPSTLYYVLATPTYTKITGELANQLEQVYKGMLSYDGTTNISQVNNDLAFVISASGILGE